MMKHLRGLLANVILAYAALALALLCHAVHEGVHALGHETHTLSLLARVFDDGTRLPHLLPAAFLVLTSLYSWAVLGRESPETRERFAITASSAAAMIGGSIGLWITMADLSYAEVIAEFGSAGLYVPLMSAVSGMFFVAGVTLLLPSARHNLSVASATLIAVFVLLMALLVWVSTVLHRLPYADALPMPSAQVHVIVPSVVAVALVVPATIIAASRAPRGLQAVPHVAIHVGLLSAALLAVSAVLPFHHLCVHHAHASLHHVVELSLVALAALGSLAIAGARVLLHLRKAA